MSEFKVTWTIQIEAENSEQAAQEALKIQRDPKSLATCFEVTDDSGRETSLDLLRGTNSPFQAKLIMDGEEWSEKRHSYEEIPEIKCPLCGFCSTTGWEVVVEHLDCTKLGTTNAHNSSGTNLFPEQGAVYELSFETEPDPEPQLKHLLCPSCHQSLEFPLGFFEWMA